MPALRALRIRFVSAPVRMLVAAVLALPAAAGCTGDDAEREPQVGGPFGARPTIVFPAARPAAELRVGEPVAGRGEPLKTGDLAIVQYTAHVWDGAANRLADSSFTRGTPAAFPVGELLPGLERALRGRRVGSRVTVAIPPEEGFGAAPPRGLKAGEELFYVVDVLGAHHRDDAVAAGPGELAGVRIGGGPRPSLSVPRGAPPRAFASTVLRRGEGPPVRPGMLVVTQYAGAVWSTRRVFDATWTSGGPKAFKLGDGGVISGWEKGLAGVPVGSRVAMVVPPAYGYGPAGRPEYGIKGSDTLVFVVDVIGAY